MSMIMLLEAQPGVLCGYILFALCNVIRRSYVEERKGQRQRKKKSKR